MNFRQDGFFFVQRHTLENNKLSPDHVLITWIWFQLKFCWFQTCSSNFSCHLVKNSTIIVSNWCQLFQFLFASCGEENLGWHSINILIVMYFIVMIYVDSAQLNLVSTGISVQFIWMSYILAIGMRRAEFWLRTLCKVLLQSKHWIDSIFRMRSECSTRLVIQLWISFPLLYTRNKFLRILMMIIIDCRFETGKKSTALHLFNCVVDLFDCKLINNDETSEFGFHFYCSSPEMGIY